MDDHLASDLSSPSSFQSPGQPSSRTIHDFFPQSLPNSAVSNLGYPQSSLRYPLCDPAPESPLRWSSTQEGHESHSMQNMVYGPFSTGLRSFYQESYGTNGELDNAGSNLYLSKNEVPYAYEYTHNDSDSLLFHDRCDPHIAVASTIVSPSARRNFESTVAYFEPDTTDEQATDRASSPSILINSNSSWLSTNVLCHSIRRRPSPYALLPALQFPTEFEPRTPSDNIIGSRSEIPIDTHQIIPLKDYDTGEPSTESQSATVRKRKAKMHACKICGKNFPRPSGLKTHMNTHNNHKPFSCAYPGCERTFTVRSNAKRHLRTHGIHPEDANADSMIPRSASLDFEVNFDEPVVQEHEHELSSVVPQLKWMPPSLSSRLNATSLRSVSEDSDSDGEDGKEDPIVEQCAQSLAIPLQPVAPNERENPSQNIYAEERDSYEVSGNYPYHASQYRRLPGPVAESSYSIDS